MTNIGDIIAVDEDIPADVTAVRDRVNDLWAYTARGWYCETAFGEPPAFMSAYLTDRALPRSWGPVKVAAVQASSLKLPEVPAGTVALVGKNTGTRYTPYLLTASWVGPGEDVFSLGALLDYEDEVTPEVAAVAEDIETVRAALTGGARLAFERIMAAGGAA